MLFTSRNSRAFCQKGKQSRCIMAEMGESDIDKDSNFPDASEQMEEDTGNNEEVLREEAEDVDEGEFDFQEEETDEINGEDTEALAVLSRQLDVIDTLLNVFEPKVDRVFAEAQELLQSSRETRLLLAQERTVTETEDQSAK